MNKIIRSSVEVTIVVFGIKVLGLIKQSVLAAYCGATAETDAFFIATGIIAAFCMIIFSALAVSLLPLYNSRLKTEGKEYANYMIKKVLLSFMFFSVVIILLFWFCAPIISQILAPTYNILERNILIQYLRILSISFVFWCAFQTINVVLESRNIFLPGKCQGFFQNLFLIIAAIIFYDQFGIIALIIAFLASIIIQCVFELIIVNRIWKVETKDNINKKLCIQDIKTLVGLSIPLMLGNSIYEINDIIDKQIGTLLGEGKVSILTYSASINEIVTGVVVSSIATVLFAHFSSLVAEKRKKQITTILDNAINGTCIIILPILIMCVVCGEQIIRILYGRGSFGEQDIITTYYVVVGYAVGFVFQAWRSIFSRVFYAFQDTKIPMINGVVTVTINAILSYLLSKVMGVAGISYATSIAMLFSTILLLSRMKKYLSEYSILKNMKEVLKAVVAAILVGIILYIVNRLFNNLNLYILFLVNGVLCVIGYIILLCVFHSKYMLEFIEIVSKYMDKLRSKR